MLKLQLQEWSQQSNTANVELGLKSICQMWDHSIES